MPLQLQMVCNLMRIGRLIFGGILAIIVIIPLGWGCATAFEPQVMLYRAQSIAGERPYCIVVADNDRPFRYREVKNRSDLTYGALVVHGYWGGSGPGPKIDAYYSLLILRNPHEVRNWSKRYLTFESDVIPTQSSIYGVDLGKLCVPVVNFAKRVL